MKWLMTHDSGTDDHPNGQIAAVWNASEVWMFFAEDTSVEEHFNDRMQTFWLWACPAS